MKKYSIILLGVLLSSLGYASTNWMKLIENENAVMFLDKDSIAGTKVENVKRANIIVNNKENSHSTVHVYEINCKTKQDHRIKLTDYEKVNAQGKIYGSQAINEPMEAADQRMIDLMCR